MLVQSEPIAIQFQHSLNPLTDYERPVRNLRDAVTLSKLLAQNIRRSVIHNSRIDIFNQRQSRLR